MKLLADLVGQDVVREHVADILERAREKFRQQLAAAGGFVGDEWWRRATGLFEGGYRGESLLLLGRSGMGKSTLARAVAGQLAMWAAAERWPLFSSFSRVGVDVFARFDFGRPDFYRYAEVEGLQLRRVEDVDVLLHYVQPMGVLFIDEAHNMRPVVQDALLRVLEQGRWFSRLRGGESFLQSCVIVLATNYEHMLRVALRNRVRHVLFLQEYSEAEIAELVRRELGDEVAEVVVQEICLRAGRLPRRAMQMVNIVREQKGADLRRLRSFFNNGGYLLGGLDWRLLAVLRGLAERGQMSIADVGAVAGLSRAAFMNDVRGELVARGLVSFSSRGCRLTEAGRELLAAVEADLAGSFRGSAGGMRNAG